MSRAIAVVAICAVVTVALRALPFVCFGGKKGVRRWSSTASRVCRLARSAMARAN